MKAYIQIVAIVCLFALVSVVTSYLHGDSCAADSDCIEEENLKCLSGICSCLPGYTPNRLRTCWKTFGVACDWILDCNIDAFLACNETTQLCDCQQPDRQVWDPRRKACVNLVGFTCNHSTDDPFGPHCIEGAYCEMPIIEGQMYHECTCFGGFEPTANLTCQPRQTRPPDVRTALED